MSEIHPKYYLGLAVGIIFTNFVWGVVYLMGIKENSWMIFLWSFIALLYFLAFLSSKKKFAIERKTEGEEK